MRRVGGEKPLEWDNVHWTLKKGGGCESVRDGRWIERGHEDEVQRE